MQDKMESVRDGQMLLQLWGRRAGEPEPRERQALVPFLFPKLQNKRLHTHTHTKKLQHSIHQNCSGIVFINRH